MQRFGRITVAAVLPLLVGAKALAAQVAGIPVYFSPGGGSGFSVAANVGSTSSDNNNVENKAWALTGGVGLSRLHLSATFGSYNPDRTGASTENTYGGMAELRLLGGGLVPLAVSVGAGVGVTKIADSTSYRIPVGVAAQLHFPLFPLTPWVAPRVDIERAPGPSGAMQSATSFRVSAGVNFNLLLGLGVHAAVDYGKIAAKFDPTKNSALVFGVGGHFNFRVPMAM